jgi:hypothetical protein
MPSTRCRSPSGNPSRSLLPEPLALSQRAVFLEGLAAELAHHPAAAIGRGLLHRLARDLQRRFLKDGPLAVPSGAGKYGRAGGGARNGCGWTGAAASGSRGRGVPSVGVIGSRPARSPTVSSTTRLLTYAMISSRRLG